MQRNGWIKLYRKEIDSAIWEMPPLYHRVWHWLLLNADYNTGQWRGTYQKIANGVRWTERNKEVTPSKSQIRTIVDFLRSVTGSVTGHSHQEIFLTIVNWDSYQKNTDEQKTETPQRSLTGDSHPFIYNERAKEVKKLRSKEKNKTNHPTHSKYPDSVRTSEPKADGGVLEFPNKTQTQSQPDPQHPMPVPGHQPAEIPPEVYETVSAISGRIGSTGIPQRKYLAQLAALVDALGHSRIIEIVDDCLDDIQGARNSWAYIVAVIRNNKTPKPKSNKCPECGSGGFRSPSSVRRYLSTAYVESRWVDVLHYECPKCKHRERKESEAA